MTNRKNEKKDQEKADRFLKEKMMEAADRYEQKLNQDPSLQDIKPSPQVFEHIIEEIEKEETKAYLSEEDKKALELGRKYMARKKHGHVFRYVGIAAVFVAGVFGISMGSEANRDRLMNAWNVLIGKEAVVRLNNEEENQRVDTAEWEARREIQEKLNVRIVKFIYMPEEMEYDYHIIDENKGEAWMFYQYKDTVCSVNILKMNREASYGKKEDGTITDKFEVDTEMGKISIMEIQNQKEKDYIAEVTYNNCHYVISGILPREEFIKMIEKIKIF